MKRKITSLLLALLLVLAIPFAAGAKEWAAADFTVQVPEDFFIFTAETPASDPSWALAGVEDPASVLKLLGVEQQSFNLFDLFNIFGSGISSSESPNGLADFIRKGGGADILVSRKQSADSQKIYSFQDASQAQRQAFVDKMTGTGEESSGVPEGEESSDQVTTTGTLYNSAAVPFFKLVLEGSYEEQEIHEVIYGTVLNGDAVSFHTFQSGKAISEETLATLESIVHSFAVTQIVEPAEIEPDAGALLQAGLVLLLFVVLVLGIVIFVRVRSRREKTAKKRMAERLSAYHKTHGAEAETGVLRFANLTDCTNEAIHRFSIYQAYLKNIGMLLVSVVFLVFLVVLAVAVRAEWWVLLLVAALVVYYAYKIATAGSNVEKVQRKIYARGNTQTAKYAFYEEVFRVSGVQSASLYPYFQVLDMRVTKAYIYLYYGPENAYIVDRSGFATGTDAEFICFMKQKLAKEKQK